MATRVEPVPGARAVVVHGDPPSLALGDVHLGYEDDLRRAGVHLPDQGPDLVAEIRRLLDDAGAGRLLLLGDVKHGIGAGPRERRALAALDALDVPIDVVPGNHDGGIADLLPQATVHGPGGTVVDGVAVMHGHTWPGKRVLTTRIALATHNHPVVALRDDLGHVHREPCFLRVPFTAVGRERYPDLPRGARLVVIPAFNPLLGGVAVNDPDVNALGPLFRNRAVDIDKGRVATLDGVELGDVPALRKRYTTPLRRGGSDRGL